MTRSSSARGMSPTRRISATYPALATRFTICRTLRIERPGQAELRDVHDRLVAELESGQVAFPAPHLGTKLTAPHDSGAPGVPCRHGEELGDGAGPRLRVADRVAGREHHAGHDAVADARLAGRRPDHVLVVAEREITERVPVAVLGEQTRGSAAMSPWLSRARCCAGRRNRYTVTTSVNRPSTLVSRWYRSPRAFGFPLRRARRRRRARTPRPVPARERVVAVQRPDGKVAEPDGQVGDDQADEDAKRVPPWCAGRRARRSPRGRTAALRAGRSPPPRSRAAGRAGNGGSG